MIARALVLAGLASCASLTGACASGGPTTNIADTVPSDGSTRTVTGDWNDAEAAALAGAEKAETVVRSRTLSTPTTIEYDLRTVLDQGGTLSITRETAEGDGESTSLTLRCRVGEFGDQAREKLILDSVADRFSQLRGVEFAPIR